MRLRTVLRVAGLIVAIMASATSVVSQESSTQHTADIWAGSCSSLEEAVVPLAPVVVPEGDAQGQAGAAPVAQSVTEVPLLLMDLLSASYAVAVQGSSEQTGMPIACGEIGGALSEDGSLAVGLEAMNGAKMSGVASFAPTAASDGTLVTVLLVDERSGRERDNEGVDGIDDGVTGVDEVDDGAGEADGVGNVAVGPAPDLARGVDDADTIDPADTIADPPASSSHPGEDGAVDSPNRDSERVRDGDGEADGNRGDGGNSGDRDHEGNGGDRGVARAGEDGRSSR
jgi:hypothetical protein